MMPLVLSRPVRRTCTVGCIRLMTSWALRMVLTPSRSASHTAWLVCSALITAWHSEQACGRSLSAVCLKPTWVIKHGSHMKPDGEVVGAHDHGAHCGAFVVV